MVSKESKILNDMAKVAIKYDNIVPYGGIFYAMNEFRRTGLYKLVDGRLDLRCANYGYQYSDIMLALFCVYFCAGSHLQRTGDTIAPSALSSFIALSTSLPSRPESSAILPVLSSVPACFIVSNTVSFVAIIMSPMIVIISNVSMSG